jgi:hypothetical protein
MKDDRNVIAFSFVQASFKTFLSSRAPLPRALLVGLLRAG